MGGEQVKVDVEAVYEFFMVITDTNNALGLLDVYPEIATFVDSEDGETPLFVAARVNAVEVARSLIEKGCPVSHADCVGVTALHEAVERRSNDMVKLLIQSGANINAQNKRCWTPFNYAVECYNLEAEKLLREAGCDTTERI